MNLLELLRLQTQRKSVGTLVLGRENAFRELFFEGESVYLCDEVYSGRLDLVSLEEVEMPEGPPDIAALDELLVGCDLRLTPLPLILAERGLIDEALFRELFRRHLREEFLELLLRAEDSFHFQEGRVPERLLQSEGYAARTPLEIEELITHLAARKERLKALETVLPSREEIFVITAEGMAYKQEHPERLIVQHLFRCIDGFRTLDVLLRESALFEYHVRTLIADCLETGFLKKTVLPELKAVSVHHLSLHDAQRWLPVYRNAVRHAVDPLPCRERLAILYQKLGQTDEAVVQYNAIGDALLRMRKPGMAARAYQRALLLKPDEDLVAEKLLKIFRELPHATLSESDVSQSVRILEEALKARPHDIDLFGVLVDMLSAQERTKDLVEVFDRVQGVARQLGRNDIAEALARTALERCPSQPAILKRLANLYLDTGREREAAEVLAELARRALASGDLAQARDLLEKVRRIAAAHRSARRTWRDLRREFRRKDRLSLRVRSRLVAGLLLVLACAAYQAVSFLDWHLRFKDPIAYAQPDAAGAPEVSLPHPVDVARLLPSPEETELLERLERGRRFRARFPLSLATAAARRTEEECRRRASELARARRRLKERILEDARLYAAEGDRNRLERALSPLLALPQGDPWKAEAEALLEASRKFEKSAEDYFAEARALEEKGDWTGAFRAYRKLAAAFPRSRLVAEIRYPVVVESVPAGAHARMRVNPAEYEDLGPTPVVVRLRAGEIAELELTAPGHAKRTAEIDLAPSGRHRIVLDRIPTRRIALEAKLDVVPVVAGDTVYVAEAGGRVAAFDLAAGKPLWRFEREAVRQLTSPPCITPEGVYVVWNDKQVWRLGGPAALAPEPRPDAGGQLSGLASTGAVAAGPQALAVGTRSPAVEFLYRGNLRRLAAAELSSTPIALSALGENLVAAALESGEVVAVDAGGRTAWKRPAGSGPPPELFATERAVCVLTADASLLFLEPRRGSLLQGLPLDPGAMVEVTSRRVFIAYPAGRVAALSPDGKDLVLQRTFKEKIAGLAAAGPTIVLWVEGRRRFLALDAETLEVLWSGRAAAPVRHTAAGEGWIVVETEARELLAFPREPSGR